ncbi:MAG: polymerase, sigma-24 subunit, subfamily [Armatimonadetes bacterium]|jgi:RNA polymerase sigma-70 factor (ECF subfamily)|nr:polymerase, sigma-24 subunit, subfamily [Armatimonadota bacterium]
MLMPSPDLFEELRPRLFGIAYRMLGTVTDAEDLVQEAYLRWRQAARDEVRSARAFLTTTVTRLSIDHLRSARVRRETYPGPWLPEPLLTDGQPPEERALLGESLSLAFLVLLESLNPVERAVFLLRDVFDYEYGEIAAIVEKSEANCRQILRRARTQIEARRPRFDASPEQQRRLTLQFAHACVAGDLPGLEALLARDVTLWSDGGGVTPAARNPVYGANKVARFFLGITRKAPPGRTTQLVEVNGQVALLVLQDGRLRNVTTLHLAGAQVTGIHVVVNPEKLRHLAAALTPGPGRESAHA